MRARIVFALTIYMPNTLSVAAGMIFPQFVASALTLMSAELLRL